MTDISAAPVTHSIERVRHELKRRQLTVKRVVNVTPKMVRVTLTGESLADFVSASYDDHVKIFVPNGDKGHALPPEEAKVGRDYTPRRYDAVLQELDVDFAIHDAGPATAWAMKTSPGDTLEIGGPRGSFVVADDFDWYLFIGDETALPAIGRRLEELRAGARAIVIAEVSDAAEEQTFTSKASFEVTWLHRGMQEAGTTSLADDAVRKLTLPKGDGYVWVGYESGTAKRLRQILVDEKSHPKAWVKAAGYWRRGAANVHESHND